MPISDVAYDWPRATCLELQSNSQRVAASAGPGCTQERSSCTPMLVTTSTDPVGRSAKGPRQLEIHLHLPVPADFLLSSVTESASGSIQVAYCRFSVQVGASGIDTGSNLVPELGLRPLRLYTNSSCNHWVLVQLCGGWGLRELLG